MAAFTNFIPHLEWEAVKFPITMNQIQFERASYDLSDDSVITVLRNDCFALDGTLIGYTKNPAAFNENFFVGKGNIISDDVVMGYDGLGNRVLLKGVIVHSFETNSLDYGNGNWKVYAKVDMDRLEVFYAELGNLAEEYRANWYLYSSPGEFYDKSTFRAPNKRQRVKGNESVNNMRDFSAGASMSRDHTTVSYLNNEFTIAQVPKYFLPKSIDAISIEHKENEKNLLINLEHLVSFLFGTQLFKVGYTIYSTDKVSRSVCYSLSNSTIKVIGKTAMPPVRFHKHKQHEWCDFPWLLRTLLPKYMKLADNLKLNGVIDRYFIARNMPLGTNLPILANAVEVICFNYLKYNQILDGHIIADNLYMDLIKDDLESIKEKLQHVKGHEAIINRIKGANRRSVAEKMTQCFDMLELKTGSLEKKALRLRNEMVHGLKAYLHNEAAYDDVISSHIYEGLFSRLVLKILGYNYYYTDYSSKGSPFRSIAGELGG